MDLVDYAEEQFKTVQSMIEFEAAQLAATESHIHMLYIPVSALEAENILLLSTKMQWYKGPSLLDAVRYDSADDLINAVESEPSILQVQMAQRSGGARRYLANLVQGSLALGEKVFLGKKEVRVSDLFVSGSGQTKAHQGEHLSIEFDQEIDISRGDILTGEPQERYNQFEVELIWLADKPAQSNVRYLFKSGATMTSLRISEFIGQDALQAENREPSLVVKNDLCRAKIILGRPLFLRNFNGNPHLSSFILIDKDEGHTVAVGTVNRPIEASQNLTKQDFLVNPGMLCELTGNYPTVIWLTGLSGSGKSTLANKLSRELYHLGRPHAVLDGDNLRLGLNRDLGFSESDRNENIRRTAEAARLMSDSGLIVIVAMITPTHGDRALAKKIVGDDRFNLVFVNTPIEVCEQRDPKGLYEKARSGSLQNFTGVSAPFDIPSDAVEVSHNQQIPMRDLLDKLLHD